MHYSMTGYGKGIAENDGIKVVIEIKTVNHRFLDMLFKLPRNFIFAENEIRAMLKQELHRGHADIYLNYEDSRVACGFELNSDLAEVYKNMGAKLEEMGVQNDLTAAALLKVPEMIKPIPAEDNEEQLTALIKEATRKALDALLVMRLSEGEKLIEDIKLKLVTISEIVDKIAERVPVVVEKFRTDLYARIKEALDGVEPDESKLLSEVAFFVDRTNIDEEITRLRAHIAHYYEIIAEDAHVGKSLDNLTQEANRETNTICSKCNDIEITRLALLLKNQIEMVREQVQNLE